MGKKRILLVSLGSIGKRHLRNIRSLLPHAEIAIYRQYSNQADSIPDGADFVFYSLEEARNYKPDAAIISSPASHHIINAHKLLNDGIALFIEKPLAAKLSELDNFVSDVEESDVFVMIGYVLRFQPVLHYVRQLLADGMVGEVHTAHVQVGQYLPDWRPDSDYRKGVSAQEALGGGALLELSHEIDYSVWLFGYPDSLQCSRAKLSNLEIDVEDSAHIILEYGAVHPSKRVMVQLDLLQRVANMALQIVGSRGTLVVDLIRERVKWFDGDNPDGVLLDAPVSSDGNEIYMRQFDFFLSRVYSDYEPVFEQTAQFTEWVTVNDAEKVLRIVETAKEADKLGVRKQLV